MFYFTSGNILKKARGHGSRSLSEICMVITAINDIKEKDWILMSQYLHCQLVNIISTPEDSMIQSSNSKSSVRTR